MAEVIFYFFWCFVMKISIEWLSQYVEINESAEDVADILSELGFPLEGVEEVDGDKVIDIEVTSNRGDCLSYIGVAREIAAVTGRELKMPEVKLAESDLNADELVDVSVLDDENCARYTARVISDVKIGQSPEWMVKRLESVGIRSVNNVVDATNYAMLETGQPPHAFDFDKLAGGKIVVRRGIKGERVVSIDETKCKLDEGMLVIADENRPIAIAGVMGGLDTEISESTTRILLEDAQFAPVCVRTTGRKLGLSSESSFRFERFVDTERIDWASQRCAQLIVEVAGGKVARGVVDVYPGKKKAATVGMRFSRMNKLLGIEVSKEEVVKIFTNLGLDPVIAGEDMVNITVPSWRHDLVREVDLIEEVIRSVGYGRIPVEPRLNIEVAQVDGREKAVCRVRSFLNGCGFFETVNVTFVGHDISEMFGAGCSLSVKDESRRAASKLRSNLTGTLMGVLKSNYNAGNIPCRVFEVANTFKISEGHSEGTLPIERTQLGLVADCSLRELRGVVEGVVRGFKSDAAVDIRACDVCWASSGGEIFADGAAVGICGVVGGDVKGKLGIEAKELCAGEVDFEALLAMAGGAVKVKPIPRFPAIVRDLSLIVDEKVQWGDITETVKRKAPGELAGIEFGGIYRGKPIEAGKKSVTVSLCFRDQDGTLRHEIVDGFEGKILEELKTSLGGELRMA